MNENNRMNAQPQPKLSVTSSTLVGAVTGAGILAAVGAGAGWVASLESLSGVKMLADLGLTPLNGAIGGALVGAGVGGLNGYASAERLRRESELLPDRSRHESWQEREIKRRAIATARALEGNPARA